MELRPATGDDIDAIAALHARSWRLAYRGSYSDTFLDGPVFEDRLTVWRERLSSPDPDWRTIVAVDGTTMVGFAHTALDDDPQWGALLDNLHVAPELHRGGIGTRLMAATAEAVASARPSSGLYLWVLERNTNAQRFYEARGGQCAGSRAGAAPDGGPIVALRYFWPDPASLAQ